MMPCNPLKDGQGRTVGFACSRGRGPQRCDEPGCFAPSVALCDFKLEHGTCDRRMCGRHRNVIAFEVDYCSLHFARPEARP